MNALRKQSGDFRKDRLDPLAHQHLVVSFRWLISALRVLLAAHRKAQPVGFFGSIFRRIIRLTTVHEQLAVGRQLKRQHIQSSHISRPAWDESKLYGQAALGRDDMHFHTKEIAPLGNTLAAPLLASRQPPTRDADVVADFNRETVEQVLCRGVGLFEAPAELMKKALGQLLNLVQTPAQSRLAEHSRHQAGLLEKGAARFEIAAEEKRGSESGRQNFGIGQFAAAILAVANSLQQIVRDTVERDNIVEHDPLQNSIGVDSEGIFSFSKSFAKCSTGNLD
jgi:hypothetical protein